MTQHPSATIASPDQTDAGASRRNNLVIGVLLVSAFVVLLNETIMSVALPHLMADLHITAGAAQWLTTAFMVTTAVVIPITGLLLQRFNTRPIFITAMSLFSAGTLIAALAPGFTVLLAGRIVQASGTAIMMPLLMTTVLTLIAPAAQGRMMGNISIVMSVAPAIGPTISGLILSVLAWRWMFLVVLPIALGALLLGALRVRNVTIPAPTRFDVLSVTLSAFGFGGLLYGLSNLGGADRLVAGWPPLGIGALALIAFVVRQIALQRNDHALLDLRTFLSRSFTVSVTMLSISTMAMFGALIVLPIYLQTVLGLSTLTTGLLLLPGGLISGLLAPVVGRIYDRRGPTALVIAGSILLSAVFWAMTMLRQNTPVGLVLAGHVCLGIGLALLFTPLFSAGLGSLKPSLYSHGSAIVGTTQQVAGAIGTALFVTVMTSRATALAASGASAAAATVGGVRSAFLCGALISLFAIVAAFFVGKAAVSGDAVVGR